MSKIIAAIDALLECEQQLDGMGYTGQLDMILETLRVAAYREGSAERPDLAKIWRLARKAVREQRDGRRAWELAQKGDAFLTTEEREWYDEYRKTNPA